MALANPVPPLTIVQIVRFWSYVEKRGHGGCWVWTSPRGSRKQALVSLNNRLYSCRRVAWELEHGNEQILGSRVTLLPKCGNVLCVRPDHMVPTLGATILPREVCHRGHKLTEDNVYITTQGKRACRECIKITLQARKKRYLKEGRGWGKDYVKQGSQKRSERSQVGGKNRAKKR